MFDQCYLTHMTGLVAVVRGERGLPALLESDVKDQEVTEVGHA